MPKDAKKNIDRYKIRGGDLNEFEFSQNQARVKESFPSTDKSAPPMKGPTTKDTKVQKTTAKKSAKKEPARKSAKNTAGKKSTKKPAKKTTAKKSAKSNRASKK